ncbi:MAG: hypothetical protein AB4042_08940 [Leptolyngbyaceae cyanobacterium]
MVGCSSSVEKRIQNLEVCEYNETHECDRPIWEFAQGATYLMATAEISDVPVDYDIVVEWVYLGDETDVPFSITRNVYAKTAPNITSLFAVLGQPDEGWPVGTYEVVLLVDDTVDKTARQSFTIGPIE